MAGPSDSDSSFAVLGDSASVRMPAVAGMFYPADARECRRMAQAMFGANADAVEHAVQKSWLGGIVPHAGWICSGTIAGQTIGTLARQRPDAELIVVFGAIHTPVPIEHAALDSHERWHVPGGDAHLPRELNQRLMQQTESSSLFRIDELFHRREHAVEVELPLIQIAWPRAALLPVEVPVIDDAIEIGRRTALAAAASGLRAVYLASSDLTHYGPNYDFTPAGVGLDALAWAKDNDRRLLDCVTSFSPESIVPEVRENQNACGGGAIAAMMAACRELGGNSATVLSHANSYETLAAAGYTRETENAVGYASVVVG